MSSGVFGGGRGEIFGNSRTLKGGGGSRNSNTIVKKRGGEDASVTHTAGLFVEYSDFETFFFWFCFSFLLKKIIFFERVCIGEWRGAQGGS